MKKPMFTSFVISDSFNYFDLHEEIQKFECNVTTYYFSQLT